MDEENTTKVSDKGKSFKPEWRNRKSIKNRSLNIGRNRISSTIFAAFDLGDQIKEDVPADVIERIISVQPTLLKGIKKGKIEIDFNSEVKGKNSSHMFDAVLSGGKHLTLVKLYRHDKRIDIEDLTRLRDEVLDIGNETNLRRIGLIAIGNEIVDEAIEFIDNAANWNAGKSRISRNLIQLSGSAFKVFAASDMNAGDHFEDIDSIESASIPLSSRLRQIHAKRAAGIAAGIAAIIIVAAIAYTLSVPTYVPSDQFPHHNLSLNIMWSPLSNISGYWASEVIATGKDIAIDHIWVVVYKTLNPTIVRSVNSGWNSSQLLFSPFRLSLASSGSHYNGLKYQHSSNNVSLGDILMMNKSTYHIDGVQTLIGYQQVYDQTNATWKTVPIYNYEIETVTFWYSYTNNLWDNSAQDYSNHLLPIDAVRISNS